MKQGIFARTRHFLSASLIYLPASLVLAAAILSLEFGFTFVEHMARQSGLEQGSNYMRVSDYISDFLRPLDALPRMADIMTMLFWAVLAVVVYISFTISGGIFSSVRSEVSDILRNGKGRAPLLLVTRLGGKVLVLVLFVALCVASFFWLVPYWMDSVNSFVVSGFSLGHVQQLAWGILGFTLNIYVIWAGIYLLWFYNPQLKQ